MARAAKISITVDAAVLREIRQLVRERRVTLSAFINELLTSETKRYKLGRLIAEYEAEHGKISDAAVARARADIEGK